MKYRIPNGGHIDRSRVIDFTFDDKPMQGHPGDTLASALLANGQHLVARSIKYHRPRGILSAGLEEPSALITVSDATGSTPNLKVTEVPLRDGLTITSQNNWPRLERDAGALMQLASGMLGPGFYYKTFMWPRKAWHKTYAHIIRRAAGHGEADTTADPQHYDKRRKFCDVLVIGSGAAGLSAATIAAQSGATVILVEQDQTLGGSTLFSSDTLQNQSAPDWAADAIAALQELSNVTVMANTLAFGQYDHGLVQAVETPQGDTASSAIFWKIRARRTILASGAIERPIVFPGNDRPGVMLANAVRTYIRRYAVAPGRRAVVAVVEQQERSDTIAALQSAGIIVQAVLCDGETLLATKGRLHLRAVSYRNNAGNRMRVPCDLLCVSAGWMPTAHLFAHNGKRLAFDPATQSLLPSQTDGPIKTVGGARGVLDLEHCIEDGKAAAHQALAELELHKHLNLPRPSATPHSRVSFGSAKGKAFVDLQNDVTRGDIKQTQSEGYDNIELTKRYTTLGMGTDQGKTSWTNGLLEIANITGQPAEEIGHTTYRPPYSPVSIGAMVGADVGAEMTPVRRTPFHRSFEKLGCSFQSSGDWFYSRYFPQGSETMTQVITRECRAVRDSLGCVDMSTLGKFDVQGPDALEFLSRLYCNNFATIKTGRLRYGLMLREDGIVFDDGTITRLGENHYVVTATTANTSSVWHHMRKQLQIDWPDLNVDLTDVTDHWATLAIAGPNARKLLTALKPDFAVDRDNFPFAAVRTGNLAGSLPVRVFSVSFSGELSFEIATPAGYAEALLGQVMHHGAEWDITPYGLETLDVLRIEKGHLSVGTEIDGRRTPSDLGMGGMVSKKKDFIGRALLQRPSLQVDGRDQLVGLIPENGTTPIPFAAHLSDMPLAEDGTGNSLGYLTASVPFTTLGHPIALAFLRNGSNRFDDILWAHSPVEGRSIRVRVGPPCAYDVKGERLHV